MRFYLVFCLLFFASCTGGGARFEVSFEDAMGLAPGSPVVLENGLEIAKVHSVELCDDSVGWVSAYFNVPSEYQIPANSHFQVDPDIKGDAQILITFGASEDNYSGDCHVYGELPPLRYLSPGDSSTDRRIRIIDNAIYKIEKHFTEEPDSGLVRGR